MSTVVETENDNKVALAALEQGATDAPLTTDGADDGELERELTQMEADADRLQKEGVISTDDANMKRAEVAKTRKLFRDLPADERIAIIKRRREIGRQLMERQLVGCGCRHRTGAAEPHAPEAAVRTVVAVYEPHEHQHAAFRPLDVRRERQGGRQWRAREELLAGIEGYVDEQLRVAEGFRQQKEAELRANRRIRVRTDDPHAGDGYRSRGVLALLDARAERRS